MATIRKKKESPLQSVADFIQNNWMVLLGAVLAYPLIVKYMRKTELSDQQSQLEAINANPQTQSNALNDITADTSVHQAAIDIFEASGFKYPWYHPKHWSEDDNKCFVAITSVSVAMQVPPSLIQAYYIVSSGRNLKNDMSSVLDTNFYTQLIW